MADFRVDPDKLEAVAKRVKALLEDLKGDTGFIAGNKPDFDQANSQAITEALGSLAGDGDGTSAFAGSYNLEHTGMKSTYQNMITQLENLYKACHGTAETYKHHEAGAKHAVAAPGGEIEG